MPFRKRTLFPLFEQSYLKQLDTEVVREWRTFYTNYAVAITNHYNRLCELKELLKDNKLKAPKFDFNGGRLTMGSIRAFVVYKINVSVAAFHLIESELAENVGMHEFYIAKCNEVMMTIARSNLMKLEGLNRLNGLIEAMENDEKDVFHNELVKLVWPKSE